MSVSAETKLLKLKKHIQEKQRQNWIDTKQKLKKIKNLGPDVFKAVNTLEKELQDTNLVLDTPDVGKWLLYAFIFYMVSILAYFTGRGPFFIFAQIGTFYSGVICTVTLVIGWFAVNKFKENN